ncbi:uncharacterized protein LOC107799474 [Nicotiana tabacum]|uniref:Uncharacterized protein LOC107799474 n=1 Tax=Nicotiana tabacum TaxID=4097 RepID=A0AC58UGP4_TOBAC
MFGLVSNGAKQHLFPMCYFRFQLLFSTAAVTSRANVLVDFLVNSLDFSTEEAISTSSKEFFMMELGYESSYLASHAPLLKLSLEKRIMPRSEILKLLKENQLIKGKLSLYTVVTRTESQFLEKYVLPFRAKIPELMVHH